MNQQTSGDYLHKYIGIPYVDMDCYELLVDFYKKEFNIDFHKVEYKRLNDRDADQVQELSRMVTRESDQVLTKVTNPNFGDIILIRVFGMPAHVGIFIGKGFFLHTTYATGSCLDRLKNWKHKILGYYKYDKV
jgi:cell wall-associated NlpC family hydrolase